MADMARVLIGESAAMRGVRDRVAALAGSTGPVLVRGERGAGKAAVARGLHAAGPQCDGPVVVVDCAELPDADLCRDLFGGGPPCGRGRLATAAGGTLVLREVAAVGPDTGRELLELLRAGTPGVRVIATTAHDVAGRSTGGELLGRLAADVVHVPPLRDRADDVPDLTRHFAALAARRERRPAQEPEPATLDLFRGYGWSRNVRELQNFVDRAYTVGRPDENPLRVSLVEPWLRAAAVDPVRASVDALAGKPLADIEKQVILSTLQQFRGHRIKTAASLGIGVRTLGIKLKRWRDEGEPVAAAHDRAPA